MIDMDDFKNPDGSIDWTAYNKARVNAGESCHKCGKYLIFAKGHPDTCYDCNALLVDKGEVMHGSQVRCPACGHTRSEDLPYDDGKHMISCDSCGHDFEIQVRVSWEYVSPPMCPPMGSGSTEDDETDAED